MEKIASALQSKGGQDALAYRVAEQWVEAWGKIAKTGTTVVVPASPHDISGMAASAMAIYGKLCGGVNASSAENKGLKASGAALDGHREDDHLDDAADVGHDVESENYRGGPK